MVSGIELVNILIVVIFLIQATGQYFLWLYWLQVKEYRQDRFLVFMKSREGQKELLIFPILLKFVLILLSIYINRIFSVFLLLAISTLSFYFILTYLRKNFKIPVFTERVRKTILITGLLVLFVVYLFYPNFWLVITELGIVVFPFLGIFITGLSVKRNKLKEMHIAEGKLKKINPYVIGITGSYGKTTTKDFLTQLMSTKYRVLSTYKNQNTHFGIIRRINKDLKRSHKYFICEIGAYKKGEIRDIARILNPKAVMITGLEPQHLDLFGSLENLKDAKYELVESLSNKGIALFNLSSGILEEFVIKADKSDKNIKTYTYACNTSVRCGVNSKIIDTNFSGITFNIRVNKETKTIKTNLYSEKLIENLTGSILMARLLGVDWDKIISKCRELTLPEGTLKIFKTKNGINIIDDSYNSSPSGFKSAIDLLKRVAADKKYIATTGIIELGDKSYGIHKEIAGKFSKVADKIIVRNKDFVRPFRNGVGDSDKIIYIGNPIGMVQYFERNLKKGDAVLLEGKLPQLLEYFKRV